MDWETARTIYDGLNYLCEEGDGPVYQLRGDLMRSAARYANLRA